MYQVRKKRKTNNYNEIRIIDTCNEIFNKINFLSKNSSLNSKNNTNESKIKIITDILIKKYSIEDLFNFISHFGMKIYPKKLKYSIGYKFDSNLFMIIRNINKYISKNNYLEKTDELYGNTLLLISASCWDPYRVRELLQEGYDINRINKNGDTILHIVCRGSFNDVFDEVKNKINKINYDTFKIKSKLNNKYKNILNFLNIKNKNSLKCYELSKGFTGDQMKRDIDNNIKIIEKSLNSETLIKYISFYNINIILPKNIYSKKNYYPNFTHRLSSNLNAIKNEKKILFIKLIKYLLDERGLFNIEKDRVSGWGDSSGWLLDKYDLRSQISTNDLKELSNYIMKSYKKNEFTIYYFDKNNKKIIIDNKGLFSDYLNISYLNIIDSKIIIKELFLEFNNNEFINKDPIYGINKKELKNIKTIINSPNMACNVLPIHVLKIHHNRLIKNFVKKKDKKNLNILFKREFSNAFYTNDDIDLNLDNVITLIDNLNNKIAEKVKNRGWGSGVDLTNKHWIFEWNVNKHKDFYLNIQIKNQINKFLKEYISKKRYSIRIKEKIKNILSIYKKYQYYGVISEFFNTWACKFYFIGDYNYCKRLQEIAITLIKIYYNNYFTILLDKNENLVSIFDKLKYNESKEDNIYQNFKSEIFENMNKWNSKKEIFDGNLKNVIKKI